MNKKQADTLALEYNLTKKEQKVLKFLSGGRDWDELEREFYDLSSNKLRKIIGRLQELGLSSRMGTYHFQSDPKNKHKHTDVMEGIIPF